MSARADNAALIGDLELLRRCAVMFSSDEFYAGELPSLEEADEAMRALGRIAAALAAAERDYLELGDELATELADERHLHEETLSRLAAAEERAQAAEEALEEVFTATTPIAFDDACANARAVFARSAGRAAT